MKQFQPRQTAGRHHWSGLFVFLHQEWRKSVGGGKNSIILDKSVFMRVRKENHHQRKSQAEPKGKDPFVLIGSRASSGDLGTYCSPLSSGQEERGQKDKKKAYSAAFGQTWVPRRRNICMFIAVSRTICSWLYCSPSNHRHHTGLSLTPQKCQLPYLSRQSLDTEYWFFTPLKQVCYSLCLHMLRLLSVHA